MERVGLMLWVVTAWGIGMVGGSSCLAGMLAWLVWLAGDAGSRVAALLVIPGVDFWSPLPGPLHKAAWASSQHGDMVLGGTQWAEEVMVEKGWMDVHARLLSCVWLFATP